MFLKRLILIKQLHQKCWIFVTIGICYDLLLISTNLSDIAILKIKNANYCCIIPGTSKSEAITLWQNIELSEKGEHY